MKKYYLTIVRKDGTEKEVFVLIPEETAVLLDQCDETVRLEYLKAEYKAFLRERAETRRHISLDYITDNGHDFDTGEASVLDLMLDAEEYQELYSAIARLPRRQKEALDLYIFQGKTMEETAEIMGCSTPNVHKLVEKSMENLKKMKKF